jgi:hypothetical protein
MELIYEIDCLPKDFCSHVIKKFENDGRKVCGETGARKSSWKKSTDLFLPPLRDWFEEQTVITKHLKERIRSYVEYLKDEAFANLEDNEFIFQALLETFNPCDISWYQIQKTSEGEYYKWHFDAPPPVSKRVFTFIMYLNTVDEECGGTTEFSCGKKVQPKVGKLLLFPSAWTYIHRGKPVTKGNKYIITGYIETQLPPLRQT